MWVVKECRRHQLNIHCGLGILFTYKIIYLFDCKVNVQNNLETVSLLLPELNSERDCLPANQQRIRMTRVAGLGRLCLFVALLFAINGNVVEGQTTNSPFGTNYSEFKPSVVYTSSSHHQVRGMEPFYNITNMILRWFEPEPMIPDGE